MNEWGWQTDSRVAYVYFLECGGFIKIGFATDIARRLQAIQAMNPLDVTLVGRIRATLRVERVLQERFSGVHHRGEWFRPDPTMLADIRKLSSSRKHFKTRSDVTLYLDVVHTI